MMTGPLLAWIQKITVQHFTLEVENPFNKPKTFTPVCRWLIVMILFLYRSLLLEDLNADGFDDLIIGAPGYSVSNSYQNGRVYIKYGMFKELKQT